MKHFNFILQGLAFLIGFGFLFIAGKQYLDLPLVMKTADGTCVKIEQPNIRDNARKYDCENLPTKYETVIVSNEYR